MPPIFLLGDARNELEAKANRDFIGPAGAELIRMLAQADIIRLTPFDKDYISRYYRTADPECLAAIWTLHPEVYPTNVFALPCQANNIELFCGPKSEALPGYPALIKSKYIRREFEPQLDRLTNELLEANPNLIITLGMVPLWALCGTTNLKNIRGTTTISTHTVAGFKILPTYHPSTIFRQWDLRPTIIADLMKAKKESSHEQITRPSRTIWIDPNLDDIRTFFSTHLPQCDLLSVDIETSGSRITCIGFATSPSLALVIPFDDERATDGNYWPTKEAELECWRIIRKVLADASIPKLFQNGVYDISFLWRAYGIKTFGAAEDTMLLSHALQPEALKGLGYLGSIYSDEGSWKHMRKKHETIKKGA